VRLSDTSIADEIDELDQIGLTRFAVQPAFIERQVMKIAVAYFLYRTD
jgi:hypothetical protein